MLVHVYLERASASSTLTFVDFKATGVTVNKHFWKLQIQTAFKIFLCVLWVCCVSLFPVWMAQCEPPSAEMASNIYPLISKAVLAECLLLKYKPQGDFFFFFSIISQLQHSNTALHLLLPHPSVPSPHPYQPPSLPLSSFSLSLSNHP